MFVRMLTILSKGNCLFNFCRRSLTTSEAATALRPFYFAVHPDLFGQHPKERGINEESLKKLNEYVSALHSVGYARPTEVIFYLKISDDNKGFPVFKRIEISLFSRDLRTTIKTILKACNLPVDYVNTIESSSPKTPRTRSGHGLVNWDHTFYKAMNSADAMKVKPQITLQKWLEKNVVKAQRLSVMTRAIQDDIDRLSSALKNKLKLRELRWASVWGNTHYRGCLRSFDRLYAENSHKIEKILKGRTLVFAGSTGVNLHGDIVLSTEHVPTFWMNLLNSVRAYDPVLERLPYMEDELSGLLNNIHIVRRQKRYLSLMAEQYEELLNKLINSLRRRQDEAKTCFFDEDLSNLELVVECESGPLTVSQTGQFLVPASCPGSLVIEFIDQNKSMALQLLSEIPEFLEKEQLLHAKCLEVFHLSSLSKDDTVSSQQMTSFCSRLLENQQNLLTIISLEDLHIQVSHYYSVMQDGRMCVPWDWTEQ